MVNLKIETFSFVRQTADRKRQISNQMWRKDLRLLENKMLNNSFIKFIAQFAQFSKANN
jgi:hypothetical protein